MGSKHGMEWQLILLETLVNKVVNTLIGKWYKSHSHSELKIKLFRV